MEKSDNLNVAICSVSFAELSKVDSVVKGSDQHHRILNLKAGQSLENIYFTPGTAQFGGEHQNSDEGGLKNNNLKLLYPGDGIMVPGLLLEIENKRGVVIYEYASGIKKIFGSIDNPVLVSFSFQEKAYAVNFNHRDTKLPYLLQE